MTYDNSIIRSILHGGGEAAPTRRNLTHGRQSFINLLWPQAAMTVALVQSPGQPPPAPALHSAPTRVSPLPSEADCEGIADRLTDVAGTGHLLLIVELSWCQIRHAGSLCLCVPTTHPPNSSLPTVHLHSTNLPPTHAQVTSRSLSQPPTPARHR